MSLRTSTSGVNLPLLAAGISGGLSVALGALGSHAFLPLMDEGQHKVYNIANQYHIVHSVAMLLTAAAAPRAVPAVATPLHRAYACFAAGTVLMAGSRYLHCTLHKPDVLLKTASLGTALLAVGWGFVVMAAAASSAQ